MTPGCGHTVVELACQKRHSRAIDQVEKHLGEREAPENTLSRAWTIVLATRPIRALSMRTNHPYHGRPRNCDRHPSRCEALGWN